MRRFADSEFLEAFDVLSQHQVVDHRPALGWRESHNLGELRRSEVVFTRRQKSDARDAAAIDEAAQRPTMRFVAVKTVQVQARSMVFLTRGLLVRQRTQTVNALQPLQPLAPIEVALVDRVDSQEPRTTLRVGLTPFANVDLGGLGLRRGSAPAPVRRALTQPVQVAVRQPRQALEPLVAKDLVLTPHHSPRGRST